MALRIGRQSRPVSLSLLRQGSGSGDFAVSGGALCWDARFDAMGNTTPRGHRVGSWAAGYEGYATAIALRAAANRLHLVFQRVVGPAWTYGAPVPPAARELLAVLVNAEIQFGTMLRALSRLYMTAAMRTVNRPPGNRLGEGSPFADLSRIRVWAEADPLSQGAPVFVRVNGVGDWEQEGLRWVRRWMGAYPGFVPQAAGDQAALIADIERGAPLRASTMGAAVLPVWAVVAVVIAAIGGAVVLGNKLLGGVLGFMGYSAQYANAVADDYEATAELCQEGDAAACARLPSIASRIDGYGGNLTMVLVLLGAVGAGLYFWKARR